MSESSQEMTLAQWVDGLRVGQPCHLAVREYDALKQERDELAAAQKLEPFEMSGERNVLLARAECARIERDELAARLEKKTEWERKARALGNAIIVSPDYGRSWEFQANPKFVEAFVRHLRDSLIDAPDSYPARAMIVRMLTLEAERDAALKPVEEES